jgi:hypothetical protein
MYSAMSLCRDFDPKQKCFRVQRYDRGFFREEFHEHVPKHRINADEGTEAIRALLVRFANLSGSEILRSLLNERGKTPPATRVLHVYVEYPEAGVVRKTCGGNVIAWVDEVVDEEAFRQRKIKHRQR